MSKNVAKNGTSGARSRTRRVLACALVVLAVAASLTLLSGCKYSDVLTEHIEDPDRGVLDENADPIYENNPDAPERPDLADVSVSDSDDVNTQVAVLPHYDPDAPDNGPTDQRTHTEKTPHEEEATEAEEQTEEEPDRDGEDTTEEEMPSKKSPEKEEEDEEEEPPPPEEEEENNGNDEEEKPQDKGERDDGDQQGSQEQLSDDESEDPNESEEGGVGGETVVVDPEEGTNAESAKGTVAAVGEYATITQMLGGAGALAASDQQWLDTVTSTGAFSSEWDGLDRVQVGFTGDGTAAGSCLVDELVSTIKPSVLLWDSAVNEPNLTDDDRAKLEEAGITVQPVPHIGEQTTEDYDVKSAVAVVAQVLEGASGLGYTPSEVQEKYNAFHDEALMTCYNVNGGYSYKATDGSYIQLYQDAPLAGLYDSTTTRVVTVYVDDMFYPSAGSATVAQSSPNLAGRVLANNNELLDVSDGVGLSANSTTESYMLIDYYLQLAGVMNNAYDSAKPESQGRRYILMPGSTTDFGTSDNYASRSTASAFWFSTGSGDVSANWHALGDEGFDTVLVADEDIMNMFVMSSDKFNGLYHMEGSYRILVVPTGVAGQWTEGHIDSFLLALWAFRIQDEGNLESAESYAKVFYEDYLRYEDWTSAVTNWSTYAESFGGAGGNVVDDSGGGLDDGSDEA